MSFFQNSYFPQGNARRFPPLKDDPDKDSLDAAPWGAPRSPDLSDYHHFNLPHASKTHADITTSFPDTPYPSQYLSPVSPSQASFGAPIHSPRIGSDGYDHMASWTSIGMPSPTPEFDHIGQHSYPHQDSAVFDHCYVNPSQVNSGAHLEQAVFEGNDSSVTFVKQEPDTFTYTGGFSQVHSSGHASSGARDSFLVSHPNAPEPYLTSGMDIDHGVPAMTPQTPPEEHDRGKVSLSKRDERSQRRGQTNTKEARKPGHKRQRASRATAGASRGVACKTCNEPFKDDNLLQAHVQQAHSRPLVCVFGYAGCTATFGSKNEWKRHVLSQHIILSYWLCTDVDCVRANPQSGGTVFNRKDLYTQHVRRMHVPEMYKDAVARKEHQPDWDRTLRYMQENAERKRCEMPTYMECPAPDCVAEFRGASAWDDRMEHVARHLDGARSPGEPRVIFGGDNDRTLTDWAKRPDVNIVRCVGGDRWELVVPLKTTAKEAGSTRKLGGSFRPGNGDEDADGEPE